MCKILKEDPNYSDIPVVLLTALSRPDDIIKGLNSNADGYITKPYDDEFLLKQVKFFCGPARWKGKKK